MEKKLSANQLEDETKASSDSNPTPQTSDAGESFFDHRGKRLFAFVGSYLLVCLMLTSMAFRGPGFRGSDFIGIFMLSLGMFPSAFGWPILSGGVNPTIGWVSYVGLMVWGVFHKDTRIARNIYFIFLFLLLLNFIGCLAGSTNTPHY